MVPEKMFFKDFSIFSSVAPNVQWTGTILAILRGTNARIILAKFEQDWLRGFRGDVINV